KLGNFEFSYSLFYFKIKLTLRIKVKLLEVIDMMTKNHNQERDQNEMITIDQLVPQDHLVRKLDAAIDFSFIYPLVEPLYSTLGRPSVDPVVLIKMTFVQYVFGIRSMRQTIKEIETNMAYRWFLGFGF